MLEKIHYSSPFSKVLFETLERICIILRSPLFSAAISAVMHAMMACAAREARVVCFSKFTFHDP